MLVCHSVHVCVHACMRVCMRVGPVMLISSSNLMSADDTDSDTEVPLGTPS